MKNRANKFCATAQTCFGKAVKMIAQKFQITAHAEIGSVNRREENRANKFCATAQTRFGKARKRCAEKFGITARAGIDSKNLRAHRANKYCAARRTSAQRLRQMKNHIKGERAHVV